MRHAPAVGCVVELTGSVEQQISSRADDVAADDVAAAAWVDE